MDDSDTIRAFIEKQDKNISHSLMSQIEKVDYEISEKLKKIDEINQKLDKRLSSSDKVSLVIFFRLIFRIIPAALVPLGDNLINF
jgi:hypothetical protein